MILLNTYNPFIGEPQGQGMAWMFVAIVCTTNQTQIFNIQWQSTFNLTNKVVEKIRQTVIYSANCTPTKNIGGSAT